LKKRKKKNEVIDLEQKNQFLLKVTKNTVGHLAATVVEIVMEITGIGHSGTAIETEVETEVEYETMIGTATGMNEERIAIEGIKINEVLMEEVARDVIV